MTQFPPARRAVFSRSRLARLALWLLAPGVALASIRYLALPIELAAPDFAHHVADRPLAFYAHVLLAALALGLVPVQLSAAIRARRPALHRWSGRAAGAAMLAGGAAGLALGLQAQSGLSAQAGFSLLGLSWMACAGLGIAAALRRDFAAHRAWMIRAAALTLAAVTLRLQLPFAFAMGVSYDEAVTLIAWSCWVPNLLVAEAILRRGASRGSTQAA